MIPTAEVDSIPLTVVDGSITLDVSRAPHVAANITIETPDDATLELLDPRVNPRVQVTCDSRVFDLAVRFRTPAQDAAQSQLELASDEALLNDYRALEDDDTPFTLAASLRDVVNYILDTVFPGTSLEASPSNDADATPYWAATNLHPNPLPGSATGYNIAANGTALTFTTLSGANVIRWTSSSGTSNLNSGTTSAYRASAGKTYQAQWDWASAASGRSAALVMEFRSAAGTVLMSRTTGATLAYSASFQTLTVSATAPAGTETVYVYVTTTGNSVATMHYMKRFVLVESDFPVPFFYGGSSDVHYAYAWTETTSASPSTRVPIVERDPGSLLWEVGSSAMDFLNPLVQAAGLRLVCDEARNWTLRSETFIADGSIAISYGVNLIDGTDRIDRDSGLWFDAAVRRYRWRDRDGIQRERIDKFALVDPPTLVSMLDIDSAYPGPGRAEYAVRRAQNRGREVTASAHANWDAAAEQPTTIILDSAPTQYGLAQSIRFDLEANEMTVNTATADIDPGAWILADDTQSWLAAPSTQSWLDA